MLEDSCELLGFADASASTDRSARVGVVGLGYVGLPLAVEFARAGFVTTGIDLDRAEGRRGQPGHVLHPGRGDGGCRAAGRRAAR